MILSLDQSTYNTGWAVFDGEKLHRYGLLVLPKINLDDPDARVINRAAMIEFIVDVIDTYGISMVILEGIFLGSNRKQNPNVFANLAGMKATIEDYCYRSGIKRFEFRTASEWRKILEFPFSRDGKRLKSDDFKQEAKNFCLYYLKMQDDLAFDVYESICVGMAYIELCKRNEEKK